MAARPSTVNRGAPTDDDRLEAFIRQAAIGVWHASFSGRMGAVDDPMAVTDSAGLAREVPGSRVVDASLFPVVSCANTNVPTLRVAEKIADGMMGYRISRSGRRRCTTWRHRGSVQHRFE